jgi:hypothetical protein
MSPDMTVRAGRGHHERILFSSILPAIKHCLYHFRTSAHLTNDLGAPGRCFSAISPQ